MPPASLEQAARAAADVLSGGDLVVMPTDTVYGLAASLTDAAAIERIYEAKQRPRGLALPVLVGSIADALTLFASAPSDETAALLERFWPGALTVVVRRSDCVPDAVTAGMPTVGLRLPDSEVARAVVAAAGGALAVTSANLSGEEPACDAVELSDALLAHVGLVIDAGRCPGGVASTVIDVASSPPRLLREGAISADELRVIVPNLEA